MRLNRARANLEMGRALEISNKCHYKPFNKLKMIFKDWSLLRLELIKLLIALTSKARK